MTIESNDRRKEYAGNGVATTFDGPRAFASSHIAVYLVDDTTAESILQGSGDYTLTGVGKTSTSVTMAVAPPVGQTLRIVRTVPVNQPTQFRNQGAFLPETHEQALDYLAMQAQQIEDDLAISRVEIPIAATESALAAAEQADMSAAQAAVSAAQAAVSASTAESAAGPTYASVGDGEAATAAGESFAVDNGDGTVSVYMRTVGGSTLQRTLATTAALAANAGATLVGTGEGMTLQSALDGVANRTALKALTPRSGARVFLREAGREGTFLWDGTVPILTHQNDPNEGVFVPPNAAAIGAWVRADAKRGVLVDWFGATPTGPSDTAVDSYAAILAALTFASKQTATFRYRVELGQGVYHLSAGITVPAAGAFILQGQGISTQIRGMDAGSGYPNHLLRFTSSTTDSRIADMMFYGGSSRQVKFAIKADVEMKHTNIANVWINNFSVAGIKSTDWSNDFEDIEFAFCAVGIWTAGSANNNDITINTCRFVSCEVPLVLGNGANIRVVNCDLQGAIASPYTKTFAYVSGGTCLTIDAPYIETQASGGGFVGMDFTSPEAVKIYAAIIFNNDPYYTDGEGTSITTTLSRNNSPTSRSSCAIRSALFSTPAYYAAGAGGAGYSNGAVTITAVNGNGTGASGTATTVSGAISAVGSITGGVDWQIGDEVIFDQGGNVTARGRVLATTTNNAISTVVIGGSAAVYAGNCRSLTIDDSWIGGTAYVALYNDPAYCEPGRTVIRQSEKATGSMDFVMLGANIGTTQVPFSNFQIDNLGYQTAAPQGHGIQNYFGNSFGSFTPTVSTFTRNSGRYQGLPSYRLQLNAAAQTSDKLSGSFTVGSSGAINAELVGRRIYFSVLGFESAANVKLRLTLAVTNGTSTVTRENRTTSTTFTQTAGIGRDEVSIVVPPTGGTVAWTIEVIAATAASQYVDIIGRPIIAMVGTPSESFPRWLSEQPLVGSTVWNPASIAAAGSETITLTVNGARAGDEVRVSLPYSLNGLTLSAWVSAANTVSLRLDNPSAAAIDLASGTWWVSVTPTG